MDNLNKSAKLPLRTKIGYGIGTAGDSVPYNLFFTYFLFFLTDMAGMNPGIAGTISFVAVLWDAVTDPAVGFISDNSRNPNGRRRPWMLKSVWPLAIVIFLLFMPNSFSGTAQVVYYVVMALLLWTFYTTYCVPWAALGAEITQDYNQRNNIRMIVGLASYPFVALCNSGPMAIIAFLTPRGVSVGWCWGITAAIAGLIVIIAGLISWKSTKGREIRFDIVENAPKENVIKVYIELFKQRAYRNLILVGIFYLLGYTIFSTVGVYMLSYCGQLTPAQQASFWTIYTVIALCCTPVPIIIANRIGKKTTLFAFSLLFIADNAAFYFIGLDSFGKIIVYAALIALSTCAFWGLYYSMVYDCSEVDEYNTGKRREGSVVACAQFFQKISAAIATSATGWILAMYGYSGAELPTAHTVQGILTTSTLIPAAFVVISMIILFKYPLTKPKYEALVDAIAKRKEGKEYSDEEFKKAL